MSSVTTLLFPIAASVGVAAIVKRLRRHTAPLSLVIGHGVFGVASLLVLLSAVLQHQGARCDRIASGVIMRNAAEARNSRPPIEEK
jgi:hypothetical protein